jgi:ABC-2 type transport system ATP-binding protein
MDAIEVRELVKSFGELKAVDRVSFKVREGEIFSLLGPNGAGKTTTISMMCGLLRPESGDALVMGCSILDDPSGAKAALGVVPQEIALYEDLSAWENLTFWGKMYGLRGAALKQRVEEVLEVIGLGERANDRVGKFSGGMKRRVNIGVALLHKPKVIFMDEPTVGIDPQSRRSILDNVVELKNQGMTVLYTTHYMEEAQELSDQIAIMDHGLLIASGTHAELVQIVGEMDRITLTLGATAGDGRLEGALEAWRGIEGVRQVTLDEDEVSLLVDESNLVLPPLFEKATELGVRISAVALQEPNLEAVFLHLTGRALRD